MRSLPRVLSLATALLLASGCLALEHCGNSRDAAIAGRVKDAASFASSPSDFDIRLALCGFAQERTHTFRVEGSPKTTFTGDEKNGTGESTVTLTGTSKDAEEGFRCEGRFAFSYRYHPAAKAAAYYEVKDIRRVGDPAPIVAKIESHATKLAIDVPATAFGDGWKLPDGRFGSAYRVDIAEAGPYTVKYGKKYPTFEGPVVTVLQNGKAIIEGSDSGSLGFWNLEAGEALFLLSDSVVGNVEVRVTKEERGKK